MKRVPPRWRAGAAWLAEAGSGGPSYLRVLACLACAGLIAAAVSGCGNAASTRTVRISGVVARSCVGPLVVGRPPACSDRAVFERHGERVVVEGSFSVKLSPGTYSVTVDTCINQQTLTATRDIIGIRLVPHCPLPM